MPDTITLYGEATFVSPYVFSSFVALREKGLEFELRPLWLERGEHRQGDYAQRSITGKVPALRHGDFWLSESSAIDEYVEDAFPPPRWPRIYPEAPRERARARQLQSWLRSDFLGLREARPTTTVFGPRATAPLPEKARADADRLVAAVERLLPDGAAHLFGGFGVADADLALMLQRLALNGDAIPERLRAYAAGVWSRPSVREFLEKGRA